MPLKVGQYLRVANTVYKISAVDATDNTLVTLDKAFAGGFTDITKAYVSPFCPTCEVFSKLVVPASGDSWPSSAAVQSHLASQIISSSDAFQNTMYSPAWDSFEVSRIAFGNGYTYMVTFTGQMFYDGVEELVFVNDPSGAGKTVPPTTAYSVSTVINAGSIAAGTPLYVRVIAKNAVGYGPANLAIAAAGQATSTGSIVCLLYTSPSPRDRTRSRMPSSA